MRKFSILEVIIYIVFFALVLRYAILPTSTSLKTSPTPQQTPLSHTIPPPTAAPSNPVNCSTLQDGFSWLHVNAATGFILDDNNCIFDFKGVNTYVTEFGSGDGGAGVNDQSPALSIDNLIPRIASDIKPNLLRLNLNAQWWLSNVYVPNVHMNYQLWIKKVINLATQYHMYVELNKVTEFATPPCGTDSVATVIYCPAQADTNYGHIDPAGGANVDYTIQFWNNIIPLYATDPAIVYDIWNEMDIADNTVWQNSENKLINTVSNVFHTYNSSHNPLIILGGPEFNNTITPPLTSSNDFTQPNLVYDFHEYNGWTGYTSDYFSSTQLCTSPRGYFFDMGGANTVWSHNADEQIRFTQRQGHGAIIGEWGGCKDYNGSTDSSGENAYSHDKITSYAKLYHVGLAYYNSFNLYNSTDDWNTLTLNNNGILLQQAYASY